MERNGGVKCLYIRKEERNGERYTPRRSETEQREKARGGDVLEYLGGEGQSGAWRSETGQREEREGEVLVYPKREGQNEPKFGARRSKTGKDRRCEGGGGVFGISERGRTKRGGKGSESVWSGVRYWCFKSRKDKTEAKRG